MSSGDVFLAVFGGPIKKGAHTSHTTNKFGGVPDWYAGSVLPNECLLCSKCERMMTLMIQIYAPIESLGFERTLYLFACTAFGDCQQDGGQWKVIRDQRPLASREKLDTKTTELVASMEKVSLQHFQVDDDWGLEATAMEEKRLISPPATKENRKGPQTNVPKAPVQSKPVENHESSWGDDGDDLSLESKEDDFEDLLRAAAAARTTTGNASQLTGAKSNTLPTGKGKKKGKQAVNSKESKTLEGMQGEVQLCTIETEKPSSSAPSKTLMDRDKAHPPCDILRAYYLDGFMEPAPERNELLADAASEEHIEDIIRRYKVEVEELDESGFFSTSASKGNKMEGGLGKGTVTEAGWPTRDADEDEWNQDHQQTPPVGALPGFGSGSVSLSHGSGAKAKSQHEDSVHEGVRTSARGNSSSKAATKSKGKSAKAYDGPGEGDGDTYEFVGDKIFYRFMKRVRRCPEQVLRYCLDGDALVATDQHPPISMRRCCHCGASTICEFQVLPALVTETRDESELDEADKASRAIFSRLDFTLISVFTCSKSCPLVAYRPIIESVHVQHIQ